MRRKTLPDSMEGQSSWHRLAEESETFNAGCPPPPCHAAAVPGLHRVQLTYGLTSPGMTGLFYEVESLAPFVGPRLTGALPGWTTLPNLRHL